MTIFTMERFYWLAQFLIVALVLMTTSAWALEPIVIDPNQGRIDISSLAELKGPSASIIVETAPDKDGEKKLMAFATENPVIMPAWAVFALHNPTNQKVMLWVMSQGVGLNSRFIERIMVSHGSQPERVIEDNRDIFWLVLEPGTTVTYAVELNASRFTPQLYLASPSNMPK